MPAATNAPPMPRTARNDTCSDSSETTDSAAFQRAPRNPARRAVSAAAVTASVSRSSAPDAFTVRAAPSARSSAAPISPTDSCACSVAARIRGATTATTTPTIASTTTLTPNNRRSSTAISTSDPTSPTTPLTTSTNPDVAAVRSQAVSAVAREIRSPGARASSSATRSRTSRPASDRRTVSTTRSPVVPSNHV